MLFYSLDVVLEVLEFSSSHMYVDMYVDMFLFMLVHVWHAHVGSCWICLFMFMVVSRLVMFMFYFLIVVWVDV